VYYLLPHPALPCPALPCSTHAQVYVNSRCNLHCTLFHFSHPADPRPDASKPGGGLCEQQPSSAPPPHERPGPTTAVVAHEQAAAGAIAASTTCFQLVVERVLLARSGVLLLCWRDISGGVAALRARLRAAFPGACSRQSDIVHSTLFRLLSTPGGAPLTAPAAAALEAACERATAALRGTRLTVRLLWWVEEQEFSSIEGDRLPLPLKEATV
jgi:hypothetical protein